ncbi:MAG: hypothetical protein COA74_10395 [Gammaproteobacteria bacterium]|nr:MAG: hypothetical protein COA74_10395 [Gammaproteobacteria bacterium]
MALQFKIDKKHLLIMVTVKDTIELPDLLKVIDDYELDEDYSKVMDIIYDFREGAIDISSDGMLKLVEYLKEKKKGNNYKLALVSQNDGFIGQSRMFDVYADDLSSSIRIFRDMPACLQWINL